MSDRIGIVELENAINFWRARHPNPDGVTLGPETRALAEVYGLMAYHREVEVAVRGFPEGAMAALQTYRTHRVSTPTTPKGERSD